MDKIAGIAYRPIDFDKDGNHPPVPSLCPEGTTDLLVLSHGWKNSAADALALYTGILANMFAAAGDTLGDRRFAAVGLSWPAYRYEPDLTLLRDEDPAGGGAAAGLGDDDLGRAELKAYAVRVAGMLDIADAAAFADLAADAAGGGGSADALVARLCAHASDPAIDGEAAAEHADLFAARGADLVAAFRAPPPVVRTIAPAATGGAAAFGGELRQASYRWLTGGRSAIATLLNQFTYYEMKARSAVVGRSLAGILEAQAPAGIRVHLIGHSFGARLVTACAHRLDRIHPASLTLLQGAFSHNGFGRGIGDRRIDGAFRSVVEDARVTGPIAVTHTRRDTGVGFFYAIASAVSGTIASAFGVESLIGGPDDPHGGLGANGALAMAPGETNAVVAVAGAPVALVAGKVNNVLADAIISGHNDVANADAARVVWAAVDG